MEQRLSECVRSVEMQLSSETHERRLQLLDLKSHGRDINNLEKVVKKIEKNQNAFEQRMNHMNPHDKR